MSQQRRMPSTRQVAAAWCFWLVEVDKADSVHEVMSEAGDWCWACGFDSPSTLERAHIDARADGGTDDVENLHLLCSTCHRASEFLGGNEYMDWFLSRNLIDRLSEEATSARGGHTALRVKYHAALYAGRTR